MHMHMCGKTIVVSLVATTKHEGTKLRCISVSFCLKSIEIGTRSFFNILARQPRARARAGVGGNPAVLYHSLPNTI